MVSPSALLAACVALTTGTYFVLNMLFGKPKWDPKGKVCPARRREILLRAKGDIRSTVMSLGALRGLASPWRFS